MLPSINRKIPLKNYKDKTDKEKLFSKSKKFCCICFEELQLLTTNKTVTRCNHHFCTSCLLKNMKYNNECPLCRTVLLSPNKKFSMGYPISSRIVSQEISYYNDYIKECVDYIINTVEYHTKNDDISDEIKDILHKQILNAFENFGMGICLNVNTTFRNYNVYNTDESSSPPSPPNDTPPDSPINSPPNSPNLSDINDNLVVVSQSAPARSSSFINVLHQEVARQSNFSSLTISDDSSGVSIVESANNTNEESIFYENLDM